VGWLGVGAGKSARRAGRKLKAQRDTAQHGGVKTPEGIEVSPLIRAALDARQLNQFYGTQYTPMDVLQMPEADAEEMLAFARYL
jgi:phosphohistidine phosphatase SixA